jgi:hypothetical protein
MLPINSVRPISRVKLPIANKATATKELSLALRTCDLDKLPRRPNPRESMLAASASEESIASSKTGITVPAIEPRPLLRPRRDLAFLTLCKLEIIWGARLMATEMALAISYSALGVDFKRVLGFAKELAMPIERIIAASLSPSVAPPNTDS